MKVSSLKITRDGQITWHVRPGFHCGPANQVTWNAEKTVGTLPVKYSVEITCKPNLDARGFLIDQVHVHSFIERFASEPRDLSCERSCMALAEAIWRKAAKDAPHCQIIFLQLTLSPAPFAASMTVSVTN